MKRFRQSIIFRIALWAICAILIVMIILGGIDCLRLRKSEQYSKPIFTLYTKHKKGYVEYYGLGYSVRYSTGIPEQLCNGIVMIENNGPSANFYWFGIPIWGWTL